MISAKEAAQQSEEIIRQHMTDELIKIENGIKAQIALGKKEYSYGGYISEIAKAEMEKCGFIVTRGSQYNEGYVVIKW